eukprot:697378-Rhodomonas_salina.1
MVGKEQRGPCSPHLCPCSGYPSEIRALKCEIRALKCEIRALKCEIRPPPTSSSTQSVPGLRLALLSFSSVAVRPLRWQPLDAALAVDHVDPPGTTRQRSVPCTLIPLVPRDNGQYHRNEVPTRWRQYHRRSTISLCQYQA